MRIAIAGGTGTVGRHVVEAATRRHHDVVLLTRGTEVDVLAGTGIEAALDGVDVLVDVLNTTTQSAGKAVEFFTRTTRHLLTAGARAEVGHHVTLSIVGIDGINASYYAGKLAQEQLLQQSDGPTTIARATQLHELAQQVASQTTLGPVTLVPRTLSRPVAASDVGAHLLDLAEGPPAGRANDLVGPLDETLADMVRRMYAHDGTARQVLEMRLPGRYGAGLASGALRGDNGPQRTGQTTFEAWLDSDRRLHRPTGSQKRSLRCTTRQTTTTSPAHSSSHSSAPS